MKWIMIHQNSILPINKPLLMVYKEEIYRQLDYASAYEVVVIEHETYDGETLQIWKTACGDDLSRHLHDNIDAFSHYSIIEQPQISPLQEWNARIKKE